VGIEFFTGTPLPFPLYLPYVSSIPAGIFMGFIWTALEYGEKNWSLGGNSSFGVTVLWKTTVYLILFALINYLGPLLGGTSKEYAIDYMLSPLAMVNLLTGFIAAFLWVFFQQMNKRFGPGVLVKYLTGKYYRPREEERIFLFMDMRSSTTVAEQIGHLKYSQLMQDCFRELTTPVIDHFGEVYQYVGDEVILTWVAHKGLESWRCVEFFFAYQKFLERKRNHFEQTYGVFPAFKAGMSLGMVTAVEVGELKTEIAFYGDVLNTASRVQGLCNQLGENLLVTDSVMSRLQDPERFDICSLGGFELRGKLGKVEIYAIRL